MFKKIITLMMALSIFTVQAQASSQNGLKAAFDELNYSLTVEWDQQDVEFHAAQMRKFTAVIRDLQSKGLTNAELIAFAKAEVKDAKVAKDLETAFNMIQINKMSATEANEYILDTMKNSYSSGASWNGDVVVALAVGILIVAFAVAIANMDNNSSNSNSGGTGGGTSVPTCSYKVYACDDHCYDQYPYKRACIQDCYTACR